MDNGMYAPVCLQSSGIRCPTTERDLLRDIVRINIHSGKGVY